MDSSPQSSRSRVRLDKWLWAARFFKTRSLAAEAIDGGKISVNGSGVKRSRMLQIGDQVRVRTGPYEFVLAVRALSERRGSAAIAQALYEEQPESKQLREQLAEQHKLMQVSSRYDKGRPTKRDRRQIEDLRRHSTGS